MNNPRVEEVPDSTPADIPSSQGNIGVTEVSEEEAMPSMFFPGMPQSMQGEGGYSPRSEASDMSDMSDATVGLFETQESEPPPRNTENPLMMPAETQNEQLMQMMGMQGQEGMPPSTLKRDAILFGVYIACLRVAPLIIDYFSK